MMVGLGDKAGEIRDVGRIVNEGSDGEGGGSEEDVVGFGNVDVDDAVRGGTAGHSGGADSEGGTAYAYSEPAALDLPEAQPQHKHQLQGESPLAVSSRDSVALNSTEWDELAALLDAFDN